MKLEKVFRIGFGQRQSRFLAHWATMAIKEKIVMKCEEAGVLLLFQNSPYRSRRCSSCGYVNEKNRKGKIFRCLNPGCGNTDDADINAAKNHEDELPDLWRHPWLSKLSRGEGFYWKPEGLFNSLGEELTVHSHENRNKEDSDSSLGNQKLSKATNVI